MADVEGLKLKISGDSSDAVKELQKLSESLDGVKNADVKVTLDISQAQNDAEKLSSTLQSVGGAHVDITADGSQAIGEIEKVSEDAGKITDAHAKITADSSQAVDEAGKVSDAINGIEGSNAEITADGSQAVSEAEKVQAVIDMLQGKEIDLKINFPYEDWQADFERKFTGPIVRAAKKAANEVAKPFKEKFKEFADAADNLNEHFESGFGLVLGGIIAKIGSVVMGLSSVIGSSLLLGGGFEAQMTSVKVISGATADELDELTKKAREMGAALPISAKDAATAMTLLAQRGTSVKDILATVEDVSNLAISQGVDMGTAADMLGTTLTNFGIAVEDASKVTAIFNNASNQSAMNISKMVEALKYVGPTAGSVGMELTEAMSAMEALANAGLTGEMIGTGLTGVLTKLASKTEILGVSTQEANGKLRPLADIFSELQAKGFSLSEATAVFGARGRLAALNLAKQSASLKENEERLKSWGSTQAAVDEKAKTFTNTMAAFRSAVEELHIEIFEQIKVQAKDAVSSVTELTRAFSKWLEETKLAQKVLEAFMQGLGFDIPTGEDFRRLLDSLDVDMIIEKFKGFGSALTDLAGAINRVMDIFEAPLEFIIERMEFFAEATFWGWILDKALALPKMFLNMGSAIVEFAASLKVLTGVNILGFLAPFKVFVGLLSSPAFYGGLLALTPAIIFSAHKIFDYMDGQKELEKAMYEEKKYLEEQAKANDTLELDVKLKIKTGFEKLPQSWAKASDELRAKANADIKTLQENFRSQVGEAVQGVIEKFPDYTNELVKFENNLTNSELRTLTQALQGNKEVFDALPEPIKKVVEQLYYMDVRAGQAAGSLGELLIEQKKLEHDLETGGKPMKSELQEYLESVSSFTNNLVQEIPSNIERLQTFLGNQDNGLSIKLSLSGAREELNKFAKETAEKLKIPKEIVDAGILNQLKKLAAQGDETAQALINGWDEAGASLESFLQGANDAINYLGASPEKFLPALNALTRNIQKIDPLTGKVTEQFKKAHDALKQWASVTFDQLSARIQRLRKAVEGGFLNERALKKEFDSVLKQATAQVVVEMKPMEESLKASGNYEAVVASEVFTKMQELGGDIFVRMMQEKFSTIGATTGAAMGQALLSEIQRGPSTPSIKINNKEYLNQPKISEPQNSTQALTISLNELGQKIERMSNSPVQQARDYSVNISQVVSEIQKATAELLRLREISQANSSNIQQVTARLVSVEGILKAFNLGNNYEINITQKDFNVQSKADADYAARSASEAMKTGLGNGII
ncbi:MAG: phage tail tape measure protein [Synergistaceae bacterium]|nr:phage tail tape measure protein [Synergistaceae bacterium]